MMSLTSLCPNSDLSLLVVGANGEPHSHKMTEYKIDSFKLLDGTSVPWLAWGCGTGKAKQDTFECGKLALEAGICHLDSAEIYSTEEDTGSFVKSSGIEREEIYITSKRTQCRMC